MNENLFNVKITVLNSTTQYTIQPRLCISKYPVLEKMISFWSRLIACCKLAPTLVRQMWRHNYVIDRNEYLIFTLLESINPWVYSLQLLFKSTDNSWRYERKCEWVFFFLNTVYNMQTTQSVSCIATRSTFCLYKLQTHSEVCTWQNFIMTCQRPAIFAPKCSAMITIYLTR